VQGKGSGNREVSRGGSLETAGFQGAVRSTVTHDGGGRYFIWRDTERRWHVEDLIAEDRGGRLISSSSISSLTVFLRRVLRRRRGFGCFHEHHAAIPTANSLRPCRGVIARTVQRIVVGQKDSAVSAVEDDRAAPIIEI